MMKYLIDTNVLIQAHQKYYQFGFCMAFWDWLLLMNSNGRLYSLVQVRKEIVYTKQKNMELFENNDMELDENNDELSEWAKADGKRLFLTPESEIKEYSSRYAQYVSENKGYSPQSKDRFLRGADLFLIAYAKTHNFMLVTQEIKENKTSGTKKVKIPDICDHFDINWMTTFQMLKNEKPQFMLNKETPPLEMNDYRLSKEKIDS